MTRSEFEALRKQAKELHALQGKEKERVSLDAIFSALALDRSGAGRVRKTKEEEPAEWFKETLEKLKGSGEAVTVARFLMLAGKFPSTHADKLAVGRWLRDAGYQPRKTGGNFLFEL